MGCGHVSRQYLRGLANTDSIEVTSCFDLDRAQAMALAEEFEIPKVYEDLSALLVEPEIDIVLNLTPPLAHADISRAALEAGKHVYSEKPLAASREEARQLLTIASDNGVRLACAPDTFLGSGIQTTRKLLDDGWIGEPVGFGAFFLSHGVEHFHPSPDFFYGRSGGPVLDMGPYYLTALVNLLGPVKRVTAMAQTTHAERRITSKERYGETIRVETPTHVSATLEFERGILGTLLATFDVWATRLPFIEIYGGEGTLSAPDPDSWDGTPFIRRYGDEERRMLDLERNVSWTPMTSSPPSTYQTGGARGIGVEDLAQSLIDDRPHRASADMAYHVLDVALSIAESAETSQHVDVLSTCPRPAPVPYDAVLAKEGND